MRIALLTEIPVGFRRPLFRTLAEEPGVELTVLYLSEVDPTRPAAPDPPEPGFDARVLRGPQLVRGGRWLVFSRGVGRAFRELRPDVVVVGGWNQPAFWHAYLWARLHRKPFVVWVENTVRDARSGRGLLELAKRRIVRGASAFIVPGSASVDYLRELGIEPERIAVAPNAVDVEPYRGDRGELRSRLGLERVTFLTAARFELEKGVDVLLRAAREVDADFAVAGSGPEEPSLRALAPPNVRFLGWLGPAQLAAWYAAADALVVPSRSERWGMVLNEAAAAGLPLIASEAAGGAWDLVEEGVNGYRVRAGDERALAGALARVAADAGFREAAGMRSRELAEGFTPAAWAASVARLARDLSR